MLEVLGGCHHRHLIDGAVREQFGGDAQGERGLTCTRGRHRQEVLGRGDEILRQRASLPGT
jgi:hypothetical protein